MSYGDVAALLSCSTDTVTRLWKRGLIEPPQDFEGLGLRFWEEDVMEYVFAQRARHRKAGMRPPARKKAGSAEPSQE